MLALLHALGLAAAAEIQVQASRPVMVAIDGSPSGVAGTLVDTRDLAPGTHQVAVRNFVGSLLAQGTFTVREHERLRLLYDRDARVLTELDRVMLGSGPIPAPVPPPTTTSAPTGSPRVTTTKGADPVVALADSPSGSLVITGISDLSGSVTTTDGEVAYSPDAEGFLLTGLTGPAVDVRVADHGALRHQGPVDVVAGGHRVCRVLYRQTAWVLDCALVGPELPGPPP